MEGVSLFPPAVPSEACRRFDLSCIRKPDAKVAIPSRKVQQTEPDILLTEEEFMRELGNM